jgi:hypothetical protein
VIALLKAATDSLRDAQLLADPEVRLRPAADRPPLPLPACLAPQSGACLPRSLHTFPPLPAPKVLGRLAWAVGYFDLVPPALEAAIMQVGGGAGCYGPAWPSHQAALALLPPTSCWVRGPLNAQPAMPRHSNRPAPPCPAPPRPAPPRPAPPRPAPPRLAHHQHAVALAKEAPLSPAVAIPIAWMAAVTNRRPLAEQALTLLAALPPAGGPGYTPDLLRLAYQVGGALPRALGRVSFPGPSTGPAPLARSHGSRAAPPTPRNLPVASPSHSPGAPVAARRRHVPLRAAARRRGARRRRLRRVGAPPRPRAARGGAAAARSAGAGAARGARHGRRRRRAGGRRAGAARGAGAGRRVLR